MAKNKNIVILKNIDDLKDEIDYKDFEYKEHFNLLCELIPNNDLEKLEIKAIDEKNMKTEGLVYVFVIQGKIFKIGQSVRNIGGRVSNYNGGKNPRNDTNHFILKSLLKINKIVQVYAFFPEKHTYTLFGETHQDSPTRLAEKIITKNFKDKHKKLPIGCKQN
ncbi:restriction endonuclease [Helicobacter cetorum]|uniref:restriction endonuclease n=1 Tax=Helicobacter cetorum TaxID=138563 RepID=UPI000CF1AF41|nr:restriction endonuclease [Helicobacter cetorum]